MPFCCPFNWSAFLGQACFLMLVQRSVWRLVYHTVYFDELVIRYRVLWVSVKLTWLVVCMGHIFKLTPDFSHWLNSGFSVPVCKFACFFSWFCWCWTFSLSFQAAMTKCFCLGGPRNSRTAWEVWDKFLAYLVPKKAFFLIFRLMPSCYVFMRDGTLNGELENFSLSSFTVVLILPRWLHTHDLINFWCGFNMVCVCLGFIY